MFDDYRRSLKHPAAEEFFDLWFYRPLAWLFVRAVHRTPITPNQVTMLSLAASLAAAWHYAWGGLPALGAAAAWYAAANVLDCADGQLARVQGSGTPNGRIVDGVADYIGTTAIFLAIGIGFSGLGMNLWTLVVLAGVSSAVHAVLFDHRQAEFIAASRGEDDFNKRETEKHSRVSGGAGEGAVTGGTGGRTGGFLPTLYLGYMDVQQSMMRRLLPAPKRPRSPGGPSPEDLTLIRLWSFLGPTTNRTVLIACTLIGRVDLYLWAVVVPGNLWLAALWYLQRRFDAIARAGAAGRPEDA